MKRQGREFRLRFTQRGHCGQRRVRRALADGGQSTSITRRSVPARRRPHELSHHPRPGRRRPTGPF
eukprot:2082197-Pleurochrysis_carterae.AAC.1